MDMKLWAIAGLCVCSPSSVCGSQPPNTLTRQHATDPLRCACGHSYPYRNTKAQHFSQTLSHRQILLLRELTGLRFHLREEEHILD